MRRYAPDEEVDFCIVGLGSAGGVLFQRLARAGFRVVGLEAGPFWDVERDWVSDEAGSHQLYWNDLRVIGGSEPLTLGENNSGKGVGGGSVHWAAFAPRLHPSDFRVYSEDGVGADWPLSYWDVKPYYGCWNARCPSLARPTFPGVTRMAIPMARIPSEGWAMSWSKAAPRWAFVCALVGQSPSTRARTLTGPTASIVAFASRAVRSARNKARSTAIFLMESLTAVRYAIPAWLPEST
jgi:hypothetical protein